VTSIVESFTSLAFVFEIGLKKNDWTSQAHLSKCYQIQWMYIVHQSDECIERKGCSIAFVIYHRDCTRTECNLFTWRSQIFDSLYIQSLEHGGQGILIIVITVRDIWFCLWAAIIWLSIASALVTSSRDKRNIFTDTPPISHHWTIQHCPLTRSRFGSI